MDFKRIGASCLMLAFVASLNLFAADQADEMPFDEGKGPPPANVGEGWCLVTIPATFKSVTRQQQIQPAAHFFETVPAKFETRTEQVQVAPEKTRTRCIAVQFKTETIRVLVRPEYKVLEVLPAQFETYTEQVEVKAACENISAWDATYRSVSEQILVSPATTYWKKEVGKECYCMCEKPAKYVTVWKEVLDKEASQVKVPSPRMMKSVTVQKQVKPASVVERIVPAEYVTIEKQIVDVEAKTAFDTIPAKFETISKDVELEKASMRKIEIPAKFETITETVLDQSAHLVWRKRKCDCGSVVAKYKEIPGTDEASLLKYAK